MTASLDAPNNDIPTPTLDLSDVIKSFANKGLSATDMIALSGTETQKLCHQPYTWFINH